jgi:hypothetical protein
MKLKTKFNNKKNNLSQLRLTCRTWVIRPDNFMKSKLRKKYKDQFSISKDVIKKKKKFN